jgi:quercetin dioxygenase-like cupin family protein
LKNLFRLAAGINLTTLRMQIARQDHLWREDTYLRDYPQGPFEDVETIFVRFPPASVTEIERAGKDGHECVWMDGALHLPAVRPLIFSLLGSVEGERLGRVMLNKIRPGGRIFPHADTPVHAEYWDRFHYVVQSSPGVTFRVGEESTQMQTGEVWWFQNLIEHEVINNSADDRIHLVIDIRCQHLAFRGELPQSPL